MLRKLSRECVGNADIFLFTKTYFRENEKGVLFPPQRTTLINYYTSNFIFLKFYNFIQFDYFREKEKGILFPPQITTLINYTSIIFFLMFLYIFFSLKEWFVATAPLCGRTQ